MATLSVDISLDRRAFAIDVAFDVDGALALVGPSGGGKSSVLRAVAGLDHPQRGRVALGEDTWFAAGRIDRAPDTRPVGFVFQDYALFPHMTVAANVAFGARGGVDAVMERVGIAHLAGVRPGEISGGERQRVAVARALARDPAVLLLDEPTAALDLVTRDVVRAELLGLLAGTGLPTLVVTHDFGEAAMLADRVGVLVDGRLRQLGRAAELLDAPCDAYVAAITGNNVVRGVAIDAAAGLGQILLADGTTLSSPDRLRGPAAAVVHPRRVRVGDSPSRDRDSNHVRGRVTAVVPTGGGTRVCIGQLMADIDMHGPGHRCVLGDVVTASFPVVATRFVPLGDHLPKELLAGRRPDDPPPT
jgi:molybdate transport system ATP-binding protein